MRKPGRSPTRQYSVSRPFSLLLRRLIFSSVQTFVYRSSPLRSTLNMSVTQVCACVNYIRKQSVALHFEQERYHRFGHV